MVNPLISPEEARQVNAQAQETVIAASCFLAIAWLGVLLRFGVRGILVRNLGWDDWFMLVTNVSHAAQKSAGA